MMDSGFLLILILLQILARVNLTMQSTVGYKDFCNETLPCNQSSLLSCQDSLCDCILPESMSFSEVKGRCVSLADEACGHMSMDTSEVLLQCVLNAFCNRQGYCECTTNHFKSEDGHCMPQKDFGEQCLTDSDQECQVNLGLTCVNETCSCNRNISIDSFKFGEVFSERRCLGRAGFPCLNGHCVPNSNCVDSKESKGLKVCVCQSGFEETSRGHCRATFNKSCDIQNHIYCKKGLVCLNGLCHCKYPRDQIYDKSEGKCVTLVGGPCSADSVDLENAIISSSTPEVRCVANAICQKSGDNDYSKCECEDGFVENKDRQCDIAYGQPCSSSTFNDGEKEVKCDQLAQLTCRDGHCLCIDDNEIFDKILWKCRGLVGSHCQLNLNATSSLNLDYCVKNAECRGRRDGRFSHGQCHCKEDTEETDARTCSCTYCNDED